MMCITKMEEKIINLEMKERLTHKDQLAIQRHLQRLESLDAQFRSEHSKVVDLIEERNLDTEQAALNDHDERLSGFIDRLEALIPAEDYTKPPEHKLDLHKKLNDRIMYLEGRLEAKPPENKPGPDEHRKRLRDRLDHIEGRIRTVDRSVNVIRVGDPRFNECYTRRLEKWVNDLTSELSDVTRDALSLGINDRALMDRGAEIELTLFNLGVRIDSVLADQKEFIEKSKEKKKRKFW